MGVLPVPGSSLLLKVFTATAGLFILGFFRRNTPLQTALHSRHDVCVYIESGCSTVVDADLWYRVPS